MSSRNRVKVIIDCDCGIDDSLALLLALSDKEVAEVLAVTCSYGNTDVHNACSNVIRVLTLCKETQIPVYKGCSGPLVKQDPPPTVHGTDGLGECALKFPPGFNVTDDTPAAAALVNLVKAHPREIILIAIGPLTNIAMAHRLDENFSMYLKSLVIMGGNYKGIGNVTEVAEFNFFCDPLAANIVLSEACCSITLVPWETTTVYGIKWDTYNRMISLNTPKSRFVKEVLELFKTRSSLAHRDVIYDCDFLAVAAALYPEAVKMHLFAYASVETDAKYTKGMVVILREPKSGCNPNKINIVVEFDVDILDKLRIKMIQ